MKLFAWVHDGRDGGAFSAAFSGGPIEAIPEP